MALGRLIERLFVQVRTDLSQLSGELASGVAQTQTATQKMAKQWTVVSTSIENLTTDLQKGLITQGQYMSQLNRHASAVSKLGGNYKQAQKQVHGYAALLRQAAVAMPMAMNPRPVQAFTRSAGMARMQMMNLGFQINDIGSTLATGMNPFTVMVQQGSQILQIYAGQGGVRTALGDISKMLVGIGKRIWPLAVIAAGFKLIQREINKTSATSVGYMDTTKAVFQVIWKKISSLISGPISWLKSAFAGVFDFIAKWFPKIMNFVLGITIASVRAIGATWDLLPDLWHDALTTIKNFAIDSIESIVNLFLVVLPENVLWGVNKIVQIMVFAFRSIKVIWGALPDIMRKAIAGAVNFVVGGVETMVNGAIKGIQKLMDALNAIIEFVGADKALEFFGFSGQLPQLKDADLSKWKLDTTGAVTNITADIGKTAAATFNENFVSGISLPGGVNLQGQKGALRGALGQLGRQITDIFNEEMGTDFMGEFFNDIKAQAIENALKRVADGVADVGGAAKEATEEVKEMMDKLDKGLTGAATNLSRVFGNAFEKLAETGRLTFGDFIKDMNRLIIKSVSEILQEELSNMFKGLVAGRGGLGGVFSNLFTNIFGGGVGARARGGVEMPWRNFVAGEEGPELISQDGPSGARRVTTAGQTRAKAMGGGQMQPVVVMNIQTTDVDSFRQSQGQIASRMSMFLARGRRNE